MSALGRILLIEDDPRDVELTLTALEEYTPQFQKKLALNEVKGLGGGLPTG